MENDGNLREIDGVAYVRLSRVGELLQERAAVVAELVAALEEAQEEIRYRKDCLFSDCRPCDNTACPVKQWEPIIQRHKREEGSYGF